MNNDIKAKLSNTLYQSMGKCVFNQGMLVAHYDRVIKSVLGNEIGVVASASPSLMFIGTAEDRLGYLRVRTKSVSGGLMVIGVELHWVE